jgi:hypothetical protein
MSLEASVDDAFKIRNYIIKNCFSETDPFDPVDDAIISLFNSIASKSEAISILNKKDKFSEISLIMRPFLEQYLYLIFILEKNTDQRAKAYLYNQRYGMLKKYKSYIENAKDEKTKKEIKKIFTEVHEKSLSGRKTMEEDLEYFKEKYISIFPQLSKSNQRRNWFNVELNGICNFTDLIKYLGKDDLYWGIYNPMTYDTHGLSAPKNTHIKNKNDQTFVLFEDADSKKNYLVVQKLLDEVSINILNYYNLQKNKKFRGLVTKMLINEKLRKNIK